MSALQDLLSRALETESHEVDMEADAEFQLRSHGAHDVFISSPLHIRQPVSTLLIIDYYRAASVTSIASAQPAGALLFPTLSPAAASFAPASGCSVQPLSSICAVGDVAVVTIAAEPLDYCTHAIASKLLQHIKPSAVVVLRAADDLPHAACLCTASWTAQHAPQLSAMPPMTFPHVLQGLSAAVATHCAADALPCCVASCPAPALASLASAIAGAAVTFSAHGQVKQSAAPPLYI
jgi:hypothetical protein